MDLDTENNPVHKQIYSELRSAKVMEGALLKRSKFLKEWRQRWVVLTHTYIATFTDSTCKELTEYMELKLVKSYKSYINKSQEMLPVCFKVRSNQNAFYFTAKDTDEKWLWLVAVQRVLDFRYRGHKTYQTPNLIRKLGFPSIEEYFQKGMHKIGMVQNYSTKAQQRHLLILKEQLAKQQKLIQQQKITLKAQRDKLKQKITKVKEENQKLKEKLRQLNVVVEETVQEEQIDNLQNSKIMEELFYELKRNQSFKIRENILEFMGKIVTFDTSYQKNLIQTLEISQNHAFFFEYLDQFLKDFLQMNRCESVVCLIQIVLMELSKHIKPNQLKTIKNKLLQFLKNNSTRSVDMLTKILLAMKLMDELNQYYRNQQLESLIYIIKQSNKQNMTSQLKQLLKHFSE